MNLHAFTNFLFVLLLVSTTSFADEDREYYLAQHLTGDNGLPQNSIKSIAADENGFIWLATESALVRYDGRKLKVYNKDNINLWSSRFVYIIKDRKEKTLYAVTDLGQILEINKSQASHSTKPLHTIVSPFRPRNPYTKGKYGDFAFYYQEHNEAHDSFQFPVNATQRAVVCNDNSIQWNQASPGKYYFNFPVNISRFFTCNGSLYYLRDLSPDGLLQVTPEKTRPVKLSGLPSFPAIKNFRLYLNDVSGKVFLVCGPCLYLVCQQQDKSLRLQLLFRNPLLQETEVRSLYYDAVADRIFIGTSISGLYIFERKQFKAMTAAVKNQVRNVFYGQMLWDDRSIVTGKGYKFSENGRTEYLNNIGKHADVFGSVIQRYHDSTIWTGVRKNLYRFSPDGKKLLSTWEIKAPFLIYQGDNGVLWLGTERAGIYSMQPDSPDPAPKLLMPLDEFITCMQQDEEETLWIGTTSNLYRLNLKNLHWDTIRPLAHKSIRSLYFPGRKELWITTYEDGIFLWKEGKVTHMPMDRNGYLKNAHCVLEDKHHYFWITTNNGLFQASKPDLLGFAAGRQNSVYYHHYTKEQGFNTNEFNGCQPCGIRFNQNSNFSFPSLNGLVWFRPAEIKPALPDNPIILDGVQIDGADVPITDTLQLDNVSSRIGIWIATAYLGNPNNLDMEYKIEGHGTGKALWDPLIDNFISFNSPGSGTFLLTIRKQSGFGADNYVYKTVLLIVPKAFWETWWFLLAVVAAALSLIFLLIKIRVHYLEKRNKELEQTVSQRTKELRDAIVLLQDTQQDLNKEVQFQQRLNASITHDIKTPIQYLTLSLKYIFLRRQREQAPDAAEMEDIFHASERIFHFTNSLTGYVKVRLGIGGPSDINLYQITEQKIAMFSGAGAKAGNTFSNKIPTDLALTTYAPLIDIILHNLIDNAIKHTSGGEITITAEEQESRIILSVADTGKGMTEEQVHFLNQFFTQKSNRKNNDAIGLGYFTIADTLEWLEGSIIIESAKGAGTKVSLSVSRTAPERNRNTS